MAVRGSIYHRTFIDMSFDFFDTARESPQVKGYLKAWPTRAEEIRTIRKNHTWDVVVVGGGIHGATMAHLCALNGLRTLLLERSDYASATSSSSSKMAHGGLRYLEFFDFAQVLEGVKAREALYQTAGAIVRPHPFFIPISKGEYLFRTKLGIGLTFYDWMVKDKERRHRYLKEADPLVSQISQVAGGSDRLSQGYMFYDGLLSDSRLTLEHIVAARQEGASCINHASLISFSHRPSGSVEFSWRDNLSDERYEGEAGVIVNCDGPWVPFVGRVRPSPELRSHLSYSKGIHLLFSQRWTGPALLLPLNERSRYYFVWPHPAGTLVGTTEREMGAPEEDVQPASEEIAEVLNRLKEDLPHSGLTKESCHYCFAGIRTLPAVPTGKSSALVSRRQRWIYQAGMLSLIGGKLTTATWTAEEGLRDVFKLAGINRPVSSIKTRVLPGTALFESAFEEALQKAGELNLKEETIRAVMSRIGSRIRHLLSDEALCQEVCPGVLAGELELAVNVDQAVTLDDVMRRRLELELMPGHGLEYIDAIADQIHRLNPDFDIEAEVGQYRERMSIIASLIRSA